jgi:predicted AlkP superfamily phosphohydrolase/phosphomutase
VPGANDALEAKAWAYAEAILGNLDMHLGRVIDALEASGRPWNVVMFTDHGFNAASKVVYPNRILAEAGLLTLDEEGVPVPSETQALYGLESAGGVHINTVAALPNQNGQRGGTVTQAEYEDVVQQVRDALLGARDPETGEPVITGVYSADEQTENGLGGPHGADLYLELAPGYYWDSDVESGPVVEVSEPFTTGIHGVPTIDNDALHGYAVLGGDGFTDGVVAGRARSTVLTPTAMRAVGLEPPVDATGTPQQDWLAE